MHLRDSPHEVADPVGLHVRVDVAYDEGLPPLRVMHASSAPHPRPAAAAAMSYSSRWRPASDVQSSPQVINATLLQQPLLWTFEDVIQGWGEFQIKVLDYERAYLDIFTSTIHEYLIPGATQVGIHAYILT